MQYIYRRIFLLFVYISNNSRFVTVTQKKNNYSLKLPHLKDEIRRDKIMNAPPFGIVAFFFRQLQINSLSLSLANVEGERIVNVQ